MTDNPQPSSETHEDLLRRYRREHALWALEGMMTWCLEHEDEQQLNALTNLENVLNELMIENARLRAAVCGRRT